MKKTINKTEQHLSVLRFIRQLFSGLLERQGCNHQAEFQNVIAMLQDIEDSIEMIAREIARQKARR